MVDFVEEESFPSVVVEPFDNIQGAVVRKPQVVQRDIDGSFHLVRMLLQELEHHRRLARTFSPLYANESIIPVQL